MRVNVSIDVPDLEAGLRFYGEVFGFREVARPFPTMAVLDGGNVTICLHGKHEGSSAVPDREVPRTFARHWTPVHLDIHVDDLEATLRAARAAGATVEREFRGGPHPDVAFCADPFGNGFCLLGPRA